MKKSVVTAWLFAFTALPAMLTAQDVKEEVTVEKKIEKERKGEKEDVKETQEIIIRNKTGKNFNLKVEVNGDIITVNGKPLAEFKDDQITINKRKITIRNGADRMMEFNLDNEAMAFNMDRNTNLWRNEKPMIKPFLGVTTEKEEDGAKITNITKGSAAEKAGLKIGDIITKVGDKQITENNSLAELIANSKPKEVVKLNYKRDGKESSVKATLGEINKPGHSIYSLPAPRGNARVKSFAYPREYNNDHLDIYADGLAKFEAFAPSFDFNSNFSMPRQKRLGLKIQDTEDGTSVKVIEVEEGSPAEKAGLKKDDLITEIKGKKISNTDEAREQLTVTEAQPAYTVKTLRGGKEMTFEIKIPKKLKTANL